MVESGQVITTHQPNEPIQGSIVQIEVLDEPENIDLEDSTLDPDDYFRLTLDGTILQIDQVFDGPGGFAQFIFPVVIDFNNGTIVNFFEWTAEDPESYWGSEVTVSITGNIFSFEYSYLDSGQESIQQMSYDVDTGVMRYWRIAEVASDGTTLFEMEIVRQGVDSPNDDESSAGLPLPAASYTWIIPALVALPVLRRKLA